MPYKHYEDALQWRRDYKKTEKGKMYAYRQWRVQEDKRKRLRRNVTQRKSTKNESIKETL